MSSLQTDLIYLAPAMELLRLLTTLTQRYVNGDLTDEAFQSAWSDTVRRNADADAAWLASAGQAVS
jgi:hypothetical protein